MQRIVVVLPTYNEVKNIGPILTAISSQRQFLPDAQLFILVVDDTSPDGTAAVVKQYQKYLTGIYLLQGEKKGLGVAYLRGYEYAMHRLHADVIVGMDADFSHNPDVIPTMIATLNKGSDVVIGSRYVTGGKIPPSWPLRRRLNSTVANTLARSISGLSSVRDCTSAFRAIRVAALTSVDQSQIKTKGYAFLITLLSSLERTGARISEIPITYTERVHGASKIRMEDIKEFLVAVFNLHFPQAKRFMIQTITLVFAVGIGFLLAYFWKGQSFSVTRIGEVALVFLSLVMTLQAGLAFFYMMHAWEDPTDAKNALPSHIRPPYHTFTVLIPARHESRVIADTIRAVAHIDYPENMVETIILCRDDDRRTILTAQQAIRESRTSSIRVLIFSDTMTTKPHALNIGLAHSKNEIVVVFDAEDEPHPQLFALVDTAFQEDHPDVLQAGVQLMNYRSHWYSGFNVLEYFFWFKSILHFFASKGFLLLGGNTVFIKRTMLERIHGWDEACLTEDADMGILLSVMGAKSKVLYHPTFATKEETPPTVGSFIKQRTRWHQGFLQVFFKREWMNLPSMSHRLMAGYILAWPLLQALLFLYLPFSLLTMIFLHLPVGITLLSTLPFYILILQFITILIGLFEFTREYRLPFFFRLPVIMLVGFYPFLILLGISTFRAIFRLITHDIAWEKTSHVNAHRKSSFLDDFTIPYMSMD